MSELIQKHDTRTTIRWKLLTGASALALVTYAGSTGLVRAGDADRPVLWVELGSQMEQPEGLSAPFMAPFMSITPTPDIYNGISFSGSQKPARFSFGGEGKISFQPEDSDWIFSAGIRYGRSHTGRHTHKQTPVDAVHYSLYASRFGSRYIVTGTKHFYRTDFLADTETRNSEQHLIADFTAGKDVGLGLFGRNGSSTINAGVRFASFKTNADAHITARPAVNHETEYVPVFYGFVVLPFISPTFHEFGLQGDATREFKGVGPTLSWSASAAVAGTEQDGELTLDWGLNAGVLFGKQKAKTSHTTQAYHLHGVKYDQTYVLTYQSPHHSTRSRSVVVPNIGGFAGLSLKWPNAKVSIGYRVDSFLNAMDTGIDTAKKSNLTFNGPYASISVGLGD